MGETEVCPDDKRPIFRPLNADDSPELTELESLCTECEEQGNTRILPFKIPFFRDVILMSFDCPHCGYKENELKPADDIQPHGIRLTIKVDGVKMMNRQIVKQASAMYRIEELDFEAPPFTSKGSLTNIEGLFLTAITGLEQHQPVRRIMEPEIAKKIDETIAVLEKYQAGEVPFTLTLEDTSGNSYIENPFSPKEDPDMKIEHFTRSCEQNLRLGIQPAGNDEEEEEEKEEEEEEEEEENKNLKNEVLEFPSNCSSCQTPNSIKMKVIDIPHFKEVVIMASDCDACGYKSNEVKAGGAMEELGTKIEFKLTDKTDLSRDVLTSDTCWVSIPDFDLELSHTSTGGSFTTIEGLLANIKDQLGRIHPFSFGDSAQKANKMKQLLENIDNVINGDTFVTIILDDPIGNSYLQNLYAPDPDPNLTVVKYERTDEQNLELGITDMKTEDYE